MTNKKLIACVLAGVAMLGTCASAATTEITIGSADVFTQDMQKGISKATLAAAPYIKNDITMVPLRYISENLGINVDWNGETREVMCNYGDLDIVLTIDSDVAKVTRGEEEITEQLAAAPEIVNDITFVPLRYVSEKYNANVDYVEESRQIIITNDNPVMIVNGENVDFGLFKAFYEINSDYRQLYGAQTYFDMIYEEMANRVALHKVWSYPEHEYGLSDMAKALIESYDRDELASKGFLKTYAIKLLDLDAAYEDAAKDIESTFNDYDLAAYYNNNYVCAKHILISTIKEDGTKLEGSDLTSEKEKAEKIRQSIISGADFDELMAKYSADPGSKTNPNGYVFTKGEMVEPFEKAAFELEEGKVSSVVETQYGYHIIKREALPEITDDIVSKIKSSVTDEKIAAIRGIVDIQATIPKETLYDMVTPEAFISNN